MLDLYIQTYDGLCEYVCNAITNAQDTRPRGSLRYPAADSLLSDRSRYGVVTAEATRYMRLSMRWRVFCVN